MLVEHQWAPMQADVALMVEVNQQAADGRAERGVGVGDDRASVGLPAVFMVPSSSVSLERLEVREMAIKVGAG
jgi:hypothetical protein